MREGAISCLWYEESRLLHVNSLLLKKILTNLVIGGNLNIPIWTCFGYPIVTNEPRHEKTCLCHVMNKAQISLRIAQSLLLKNNFDGSPQTFGTNLVCNMNIPCCCCVTGIVSKLLDHSTYILLSKMDKIPSQM